MNAVPAARRLIVGRAWRRLVRNLDTVRRRFLRLPEQTVWEVALFQEVFRAVAAGQQQPLKVFEWGAGASTLYYPHWFLKHGIEFEWDAVDSSRTWHERVTRRLQQAGLGGRVRVHLSEFSPFWEDAAWDHNQWRWQGSAPCTTAVRTYVALPRELGRTFDVLIVDGRYRKQCLYVAREVLASNGVAVLHDAGRSHYQAATAVFPFGVYVSGGRRPGSPVEHVTWIGSVRNSDVVRYLAARFASRAGRAPDQSPGR